MTEAEAKTKWCPMSRDERGNRLAYGDIPDDSFPEYAGEAAQNFPCIGSACMMWRWKFPNGAANDNGHCGLAGKP